MDSMLYTYILFLVVPEVLVVCLLISISLLIKYGSQGPWLLIITLVLSVLGN
jgi:hypothetical protein